MELPPNLVMLSWPFGFVADARESRYSEFAFPYRFELELPEKSNDESLEVDSESTEFALANLAYSGGGGARSSVGTCWRIGSGDDLNPEPAPEDDFLPKSFFIKSVRRVEDWN